MGAKTNGEQKDVALSIARLRQTFALVRARDANDDRDAAAD
jgi:hypothetical protein